MKWDSDRAEPAWHELRRRVFCHTYVPVFEILKVFVSRFGPEVVRDAIDVIESEEADEEDRDAGEGREPWGGFGHM